MKIQQFDFSVDVIKSLLWQYNEAQNLESLVTYKQQWVNNNQQQFWSDWYNNVFNLITANAFGLSVWSIILNIPLLISEQVTNKICWGFDSPHKNYDNGNYTASSSGLTLTIEEQRIILRLRYFQFCNRGSSFVVNKFIKEVFTSLGNIYMVDNLNMTITYIFEFVPSPNLLDALKQYDLLPRPAAVGINYFFTQRETWGFDSPHKNYDNGTYIGN